MDALFALQFFGGIRLNKEEYWIRERLIPDFEQGIRAEKLLFSKRTPYQFIEIYDSSIFGKMLVLDGAVQTTEKDEGYYHEMLVAVPVIYHGMVKKALIIGGGDGGSLRRLLSFPVDEAWMCELDREVTEACRTYIPEISEGAFDDPRARVVFEDGYDFLVKYQSYFDVIIVDSPDPVGEAAKLISEEFFQIVSQALKQEGIFVCQSGSPIFHKEENAFIRKRLSKFFKYVFPYLGHVPSYPGVIWSYTFASNRVNPLEIDEKTLLNRMAWSNLKYEYLTAEYAKSCFSLPACFKNY